MDRTFLWGTGQKTTQIHNTISPVMKLKKLQKANFFFGGLSDLAEKPDPNEWETI